MKIITLNTWGGKVYKELVLFFQEKSKYVDIFCLQEVFNNAPDFIKEDDEDHLNLFSEITALLPEFTGYYSAQVEGEGLATFVRKNIEIEKFEFYTILSHDELKHIKTFDTSIPFPRIVQSFKIKNSNLTIYNFHGIPKFEKKDTPERDLQTDRLLKILDKSNTSKVLVGDFNLNPDTKSIHLIGENMRNLITESNFKTTRTYRYDKIETLPFADYVFVSKDLEVKDFQVLQNDVSDHLPLLLELK